MIRWILACGLFLTVTAAAAQDDSSWEQVFYDVMSADGIDTDEQTGEWAEAFELLSALADHPLNLNTASRKELEQLPFLSAIQIDDIEEYRYRYGRMKSLAELRMIPSLDAPRISLLRYFVRIDAADDTEVKPRLSDVFSHSRQTLMGYVNVPFFTRRGDQNGYLGYRYKHWLQYDLTANNRLRAGFVAAQDAGEPFFSSNNRAGYDFYSFYIQIWKLGRVENAVLGKYKVSAGMGLVLSNAFSLGKVAALQNLGRTTAVLRPHSSRSTATYLQGAAATVRLSQAVTTTAFVSYRPFDATLTSDGDARTLITSGYHRTPLEMSKKNNTHAAAAGMRLNGDFKRLHAGLNVVYTHLDRRLQPDTKVLYRRHYASGTDFLNVSADYSYLSRRFTLNGETAVDGHGAVATLNTATVLLTDGLQLMGLQRFYSYRYTSLYARSLSEGGRVQNESGVMGGLTWQVTPRLRLQGYTDYAYMPWPRYQVSQAGSHCSDHFISATYTSTHWSLLLRYRLHRRQRDNASKTALDNRREQRLRLALTLQPSAAITTTTQGDLCLFGGQTSSRGYALSQLVSYAHSWLNANISFAYFNTDDSSTRIYLYERSPLYSFSFPSLSGQGLRYSFYVRATPWQQLSLTAKLSVTNYFDRTVIGTGYQQTEGSSQTALELQCRWRF